MGGGLFNPENKFWRATEKLVDLVILSVFWLFCSLPLVTLGPATAALYRAVVRCIRGNTLNSWGLFFVTFKENFKVGALTSLVVLPAGALLLVLDRLLSFTAPVSSTAALLFTTYHIFLLMPLGFACYLFPVLSQFDFNAGGLLSNCGKLALAHLPTTLALALLLCGAWLLSLHFLLLITVLPALLALIHSLLLERIFAPYVRAQQDEEGLSQ